MKRQDYLKALKLARSPDFQAIPYLSQEMAVFEGCAGDKQRRAVTLRELASLLVGHCAGFNGAWLHAEEAEVEALSRRFDLVG